MPTLFPADPQDVLDLGLHAAAMSRACGLWVALKIAVDVADGTGIVQWGPDRTRPTGPARAVDHQVTGTLLQPALGMLERSRDGVRTQAALDYAVRNGLNRIERLSPGDRIGVVAAGPTFLQTCQALRTLGLDTAPGLRLLRLGMITPIEPSVVIEFADGLDEIVVVEEKRPFVEDALRVVLYGRADVPRISGKRDPDGKQLLPAAGELGPDLIAKALAARLHGVGGFASVDAWRPVHSRTELPLAVRTPYFCSGCPHNSSTKVPDGSLVGAGIGCHGLVALMSPTAVGNLTGLTQMGGEGAQWIGMQPFVEQTHLLQNLGDGTFHHSGSLAVRAAVAAGVNITYKLLYNSAVAMTGGQQPVGVLDVPRIARALLAEGVNRIIVTTEGPKRYRRRQLPRGVALWRRDRLEEAQRVLAATPGVTVLIHDQECATELRRKRKRGLAPDPVERVLINERVCEGCGDCGSVSNCLSVHPVETEFGRKTRIDQSSCNKDYSCLGGDCPSFLTVTPSRGPSRRRGAPHLDRADLSSVVIPARSTHTTRIVGIGGTGVVTLTQVLASAAARAGRSARALDQTGLAQKGGAVVSDLKVSNHDVAEANKAAAGECNLYLGCDLLAAADPRYLSAADAGRTIAVVSTSLVPTGQMVIDPDAVFPDQSALVARIAAAATDGAVITLDARELSTTLLGEDQFANMLLAGAAFQAGALPIDDRHIEEAIRGHGVKVEQNIQAFRRGRQAVADPDALDRTIVSLRGTGTTAPEEKLDPVLIAEVGTQPGTELARLLEIRVPDLVAYQNLRYARSYLDVVGRVRAVEAARVGGTAELSETVARYLYKLMAYKDEYEVARLSLGSDVTDAARARFGDGAKVSYRLHPPVLRILGLRRKITLGPWFRHVFRALAAVRRVRGTAWDPFGYARVRRVERQLVGEYRETVEELIAVLTPENHALAVEIAALPDLVRGYGGIKLRNVELYRTRASELRRRLSPLAVHPPNQRTVI